ncbi:hypothetical protein CVT26_006833 [Gymnopilus dilepis]|uniref:F-box domain-containing protein n=1 Tax=Gymnopilus dilepis TaxID=231916 RepID=A0A409VMZ5_9AGAR|nr:hypothetical protein CVT26_006833 [Gymnopilus dilepis]
MTSLALKAPPELYFMIVDLIPGSTKVSLLQTCHYLFSVVVSALYRHIKITGVGARLLALTILTSKRMDYATLIRSVCYTGSNIDDLYLTYPLLVDAICCMKYLTSMSLSIPRHHTSTFMTIVMNKGLARSPSSFFASIGFKVCTSMEM